jgi:dihydrofolate reductase
MTPEEMQRLFERHRDAEAARARQYLATGLLDELHLHLSPGVLGEGERLLESVDSDVRLEQLRAVEAPGVVHLYYRVVR